MSNGASELYYPITWDAATTYPYHSYSMLDDPDGQSEKVWSIQTTTGGADYGMVIQYSSRLHPGVTTGQWDNFYSWTTNSSGNPYVNLVYVREDYNNPGMLYKASNQTLDQYGNVTQRMEFGYSTTWSVPLVRTYNYTYLNNSNYTSRYIFNRLLTSTVTDGVNTATLSTNTYDNTLISDVPGINSHDSSYSTGFTYRGNLGQSTTLSGVTSINYDIGGNVTSTTKNGLLTSVTTNSSTNWAAPSLMTTGSLSSSANYTPFLGISSASGPNGDTASVGYSGSDRPTSTTAPTGAVTNYTYVDGYNPTKTATTNGHWVKTIMDGWGRTVETDSGYGSTTLSIVKQSYISCGCSANGKLYQVSQPYAPGGSPVYTTYHYDGLGRTTSTVAPDGSTTTYAYSGNVVTVTDPAGKWKKFTTDSLGNLITVQEPDPSLGTVSTNYTYDILDHLVTVSMPRGSNTQTRTFNYTSSRTVGNDLLSATNPENGTVTYTYNSDHTLATKTDAKNQLFTYTYDSYKRLTQVKVNGNVIRTLMYDTNTLDSNFSGSYTAGRLVAVQNPSFSIGQGSGINAVQFTEMFGYTQAGQANKKRLQVAENTPVGNGYTNVSVNLDASYTYDNEGKMTSVTYPATYGYQSSTPGPTYTYSFDSMSRLLSMTDQNNNTIASNAQYNAASQLLSLSYAGTTETRTYNSMLQVTNITIPGQLNMTYNFPTGSNNGKISSQTDAITAETVTYQYDSLNRLLSASGSGWGSTYGYDGFGNLTSKTPTAGSPPTLSIAVDPATNRVLGQSWYYDANGNQQFAPGLPGLALLYDAENRLTIATGLQYAYDSRNKRIWKATFDGNGNVSAQEVYFYGVDGQKLGTYSIGPFYYTQNIVVLADSSTSLAQYFGRKRVDIFQDRLGSRRAGSQGRYYPYGEDGTNPMPNDQVKFATYTRDSATGLDYADQRYYDNLRGRFTSPDRYVASSGPKDPGSWNRYSYVASDPVNLNDPRGLSIQAPDDNCGPNWITDPSLRGPCDGGDGGWIGGAGGSDDCSELGFMPNPTPNPWCQSGGGIPAPPAPPSPDMHALCETQETLYIESYLMNHGSPFALYAPLIVSGSDINGLDDRFIVALAGVESGYGKHLGWGPYNAWNNGAHKKPGTYYNNWVDSIADVILALANSPLYTPYQSTKDIYSVWEEGDVNKPAPAQSTLDDIYGKKQLGGDINNIRTPRCPN